MKHQRLKIRIEDPKNNPILQFIYFIVGVSVLFFIAVATNITPLLRGPAPWPPEWQWGYLYINTLPKILPALLIALLILWVYWRVEHLTKEINLRTIPLILATLVILDFSFQLAVLFYSRAGLNVLIHRIINPDLNGYYTAAIQITNLTNFLSNYHSIVLTLPMHAQGHPPGGVMFYWAINFLFQKLTFFNSLVSSLNPSHEDVSIIWNTLKSSEKTTALFSAIFIPFLASLTIVPLYYATQRIYQHKTAMRVAIVYCFIPSIVLFVPINDVFLPLITASALYMFTFKSLAIEKNIGSIPILIYLSGLLLSLGILFSLTFIPIIFAFILWALFDFLNKRISLYLTIRILILFGLGILTFPFLGYVFFHFNWYLTALMNVHGLPPRSYWSWLLYNPYDFFIFIGIPYLIGYVYYAFQHTKRDTFYVSFLITFILLVVAGSVRGEVGRIWIPFVPMVISPVTDLFTRQLHLSTRTFLVILLIQIAQVLVLQTFWVTLW